MVKVANIRIEEVDFKKETTPEFKQCLELVPDLTKLLPVTVKYKVRFELHETNASLANAVRRCILNESPVKSLQYDEYRDVDISDQYILSDFLKKQIDLVPINQDISADQYAKYSIELKVDNDTDVIIDVSTRDFIISEGSRVIPTEKIMSPLIILCRLRPGEHLYIKNIKVIENIGRVDGGSFNNVSNIYYEPLGVIPLDAEKAEGASSMTTNPIKFLIGYSTHRNTKAPLEILKTACDTLIKRLEVISGDFVNITNKSDYYYSDLLQLETHGNIKEIHFKNENWTLANLLAHFCFILTKGNIKFVAPAIIHPEKEIGVVRIIHPEFAKLVQDAIAKSIEELSIIKKL